MTFISGGQSYWNCVKNGTITYFESQEPDRSDCKDILKMFKNIQKILVFLRNNSLYPI